MVVESKDHDVLSAAKCLFHSLDMVICISVYSGICQSVLLGRDRLRNREHFSQRQTCHFETYSQLPAYLRFCQSCLYLCLRLCICLKLQLCLRLPIYPYLYLPLCLYLYLRLCLCLNLRLCLYLCLRLPLCLHLPL